MGSDFREQFGFGRPSSASFCTEVLANCCLRRSDFLGSIRLGETVPVNEFFRDEKAK